MQTAHIPQAGSLLSAQAFERHGRPLKHWSGAERARLVQTLEAVHAAWCEDWGLAPGSIDERGVRIVDNGAAMPLDEAGMRVRLGSALLGAGHGDREAGACALAADPPSVWVDALVDEAVADWDERMHGGVGRPVEGGSAAAALHRPWSGTLTLRFTASSCAWHLALDGCQVQAVLGAASTPVVRPVRAALPRVAALAPALSDLTVDLCAELMPVSLRLGACRDLRIGDVLQLTHRLDQPLRLGVQPDAARGGHAASPLCEAWLGRRGPLLAVQCAQELAS